jgi:DNA-binding response OmpR family regulator
MKKKKKILIIDDEEGFTLMVKMGLEHTGKYEVRTETKGTNGFDAAREFKPDLILLDVVMPDVQGGEVAYQLKNNHLTSNIPIVFLTAIATKDETEELGEVIGGHPVIAKEAELKELINCIEKNIG